MRHEHPVSERKNAHCVICICGIAVPEHLLVQSWSARPLPVPDMTAAQSARKQTCRYGSNWFNQAAWLRHEHFAASAQTSVIKQQIQPDHVG